MTVGVPPQPQEMGTSTGSQQPTTILDLGASVQHPVSCHHLTTSLLCGDDLSLGHRKACDVLTHHTIGLYIGNSAIQQGDKQLEWIRNVH